MGARDWATWLSNFFNGDVILFPVQPGNSRSVLLYIDHALTMGSHTKLKSINMYQQSIVLEQIAYVYLFFIWQGNCDINLSWMLVLRSKVECDCYWNSMVSRVHVVPFAKPFFQWHHDTLFPGELSMQMDRCRKSKQQPRKKIFICKSFYVVFFRFSGYISYFMLFRVWPKRGPGPHCRSISSYALRRPEVARRGTQRHRHLIVGFGAHDITFLYHCAGLDCDSFLPFGLEWLDMTWPLISRLQVWSSDNAGDLSVFFVQCSGYTLAPAALFDNWPKLLGFSSGLQMLDATVMDRRSWGTANKNH